VVGAVVVDGCAAPQGMLNKTIATKVAMDPLAR
jgi:hypothetical protein